MQQNCNLDVFYFPLMMKNSGTWNIRNVWSDGEDLKLNNYVIL